MKFFCNKKATSSVAIVSVLIVGTLIFSVAAAVGTGLLTFTFLPYEKATLTDFAWGSNYAYCQITVKNVGTASLSILIVKINGVAPKSVEPTLMTPFALDKDASVVFTLTPVGSLTHGSTYEFTVVTTKGNGFSSSFKV